MNYDAVTATGVLLLVLFSASVMAGSRIEYEGKLYQFRDSGSAVSSADASDSKHKFRPRDTRSGTQAPTGRSIGGRFGNDQGYVFRPLRNRDRWNPAGEDARQDAQACPAIEERPRERNSSPSRHRPYSTRNLYPGGSNSPSPPPGGYLYPSPETLGYPPW